MVDILNFSIFDLVGLGDVTGIELIFATSALIGGILFTLYFFLLMVGGIATDIFDGELQHVFIFDRIGDHIRVQLSPENASGRICTQCILREYRRAGKTKLIITLKLLL